ncbi:kinesin-like protein KIN-14R [Asparagus officinalis]|uniref:kinesin-like protein KIN-14R n=1 Tax=Asparagus officinalis TaxID=4686 RepID=UPI00098E2D1E|nr:kinesin-like protein KIN-14R [Asparagus officinalis]
MEGNPVPNNDTGQSKLQLSITSPDPELPSENIQETPDYIRKKCRRVQIAPVELFSEKSPKLSEEKRGSVEESKDQELSETIMELRDGSLSINVGGINDSVACDGIDFRKDCFFTGGDDIRTDVRIGDGEGLALYQSARIGDFSYIFPKLEAGEYIVDLHLAEIVFVDGPRGMRVFDIFIQEEKVVPGIDIYSQVGSNQPLILSDLRAYVVGDEGLSIRFKGVVGKPIVCGISIRRYSSTGEELQRQEIEENASISVEEEDLSSNSENCIECRKLKQRYNLLLKEQLEVKRLLEDLKKENELKSRECHEAWTTLHELQMELMRKSMHVGSLAFAVEGQVREKGRWFQSLEDLSEKFKMLKIEHAKLSEEALEYRKCLSDMTQMAKTIQSTVDHHLDMKKEYEGLKFMYAKEAKERRDLYNKVIELKGNIRVFCRCRPLNSEEIAGGATMAVEFESAKDGELTVKSSHGSFKKVFKFDSVFSPEDDQERVFEKTSPLVVSVLDGFNVCIFAYGQTGTGKTFTMEGTEEARGVNFRTLEELFRVIRERQGMFKYELTVSVLEVYNEQIRDLLLQESHPGVAAKRLEVRQVAEGVHHVPGLVEANVSNMSEVWEVLQTGSKARAVGATNANEHSSRSHCIHCVMVKGENLVNGECTKSKLWLVDLSGSERVAKTDAQGDRLKEAQSINRSLSALGDVISALATKSPHIPFRNSKLTHLLQDSLGGDSKTLMFVQISPNENDVGETLCSLNFASRVRGIELGPAKKQVDGYKQMVEKAKNDIKNKDGQMKKMEETIHSLEVKNKAKDLINKNLQDKVKELESQLLIERKLARQHVDNKIAENHQQQKQQKQKQLETKNHNHVSELGNVSRPQPLTENNIIKPVQSDDNTLAENNILKNFLFPKDKENKPEFSEEQPQRNAGRFSLFHAVPEIPIFPAARCNSLIPPSRKASRVSLGPAETHPSVNMPSSRRNSLIPIPGNATINVLQLIPSPDINTKGDGAREGEDVNSSQMQTTSSSKKLKGVLRRSLQKKKCGVRSPLPQTVKRRTVAGLENVRVSIGGSGRMARRVMVRDGARAAEREMLHIERSWMQRTDSEERFHDCLVWFLY